MNQEAIFSNEGMVFRKCFVHCWARFYACEVLVNLRCMQIMGLALRNHTKQSVPSRELKELCLMVKENEAKISSRVKILGKPAAGNCYNHGSVAWQRMEKLSSEADS